MTKDGNGAVIEGMDIVRGIQPPLRDCARYERCHHRKCWNSVDVDAGISDLGLRVNPQARTNACFCSSEECYSLYVVAVDSSWNARIYPADLPISSQDLMAGDRPYFPGECN